MCEFYIIEEHSEHSQKDKAPVSRAQSTYLGAFVLAGEGSLESSFVRPVPMLGAPVSSELELSPSLGSLVSSVGPVASV